MASTVNAVIMLKRGTAEAWARNNPVLARGEAGFEIDTNRLKIGNGEKAWNDLMYQDQNSIIEAETYADFPAVGNTHTIYKASNEKKLYQWNATAQSYETLTPEGADYNDIKIINGGNANGTT